MPLQFCGARVAGLLGLEVGRLGFGVLLLTTQSPD